MSEQERNGDELMDGDTSDGNLGTEMVASVVSGGEHGTPEPGEAGSDAAAVERRIDDADERTMDTPDELGGTGGGQAGGAG
jgi:hypothetical protein